jgi:hypothetical protein
MYEKSTGSPCRTPMMIYPAVHYTMEELVGVPLNDYIPGCFSQNQISLIMVQIV